MSENPFSLEGKTVLVTGGGGSIGPLPHPPPDRAPQLAKPGVGLRRGPERDAGPAQRPGRLGGRPLAPEVGGGEAAGKARRPGGGAQPPAVGRHPGGDGGAGRHRKAPGAQP